MRWMVALVLVALSCTAVAGGRTLVVGAGDCRDGVLLGSVADFQTRSRRLPGVELFEHDDVLNQVRPQPRHSLEDVERQLDVARSLLYSGEYPRALELAKDALASLDRASPRQAGLWAATVNVLMLTAQVYKSLDRIKDSGEAFRRILRVEPRFLADPGIWPPSTIRAMEAVRKELQHSKKGLLQVATLVGSGASVFIDGREAGKTPLRVELPRGTYRLSVSSEDSESFPRVVKLEGEAVVQVDLAFEGGVRAQVPLCLVGEDAAAIRLASTVGAAQLVVLRNTGQNGNSPYLPYLTGVLYEVAGGERVRNAGIPPEQLQDLMMYLFTGKPDISNLPTPMVAPIQASEGPLMVDVGRPAARASPWRSVGYTALAVGAAGAVAGAVVFAMAPTVRKDSSGNVLREDVGAYGSAQTQQALGVGILVGGAAIAAAGGAMLLFAPLAPSLDASVEASVLPAAGGMLVVVGGRY